MCVCVFVQEREKERERDLSCSTKTHTHKQTKNQEAAQLVRRTNRGFKPVQPVVGTDSWFEPNLHLGLKVRQADGPAAAAASVLIVSVDGCVYATSCCHQAGPFGGGSAQLPGPTDSHGDVWVGRPDR